jgi:hypothetical protein
LSGAGLITKPGQRNYLLLVPGAWLMAEICRVDSLTDNSSSVVNRKGPGRSTAGKSGKDHERAVPPDERAVVAVNCIKHPAALGFCKSNDVTFYVGIVRKTIANEVAWSLLVLPKRWYNGSISALNYEAAPAIRRM